MEASHVAVVTTITCMLTSIESLPFSAHTCNLAGIAFLAVLMMLLQTESSNNSTASQAKQWWYRDPTGKAHGPFSAHDMARWYKEGYMGPTLMVKFSNMVDFKPLREMFPKGSVPFTSAPQVPTEAKEFKEPGCSSDDDDEEAVIREWRKQR